MISKDQIKRLNLKQEGLFLEAVDLLEQAQVIAKKNKDFVQYERDFEVKAERLREAAAIKT